VLEDGSIFNGYAFGASRPADGEVVFSTSMVGYPEALTDPSYRGQILCLTYPLVGNYGVPSFAETAEGLPIHFESERIQTRGLIVHEVCREPSHYQSTRTLHQWLSDEGIPGVWGVDTRRLTRSLRERGVMLGRIEYDLSTPSSTIPIPDPNKVDLVSEVTTKEIVTYRPDSPQRVVLIDCGVKYGIIRNLLKRGLSVTRVPYTASTDDILQEDPDGLVISNGPGDPKTCTNTIRTIRELIDAGLPLLGICLGNQLIALAEGADTYKMKYGHRSQNQPVLDLETNRCYITTQNHGYAVDHDSVRHAGLKVWYINANDKTVEGIRHPTKPVWGVQWHPEASPGPTDTEFIFDLFAKEVVEHAAP